MEWNWTVQNGKRRNQIQIKRTPKKKLSKKDFKYIKNKLFFPGWMGMRRPRFLSERNGEPSSLYRTVLEECNGWLCALGINGLVYRIGRMLAWSWTRLVGYWLDLGQDWSDASLILDKIGRILAWSWTRKVGYWLDLEQDWSYTGLILNKTGRILAWSWTRLVGYWLDLNPDWSEADLNLSKIGRMLAWLWTKLVGYWLDLEPDWSEAGLNLNKIGRILDWS